MLSAPQASACRASRSSSRHSTRSSPRSSSDGARRTAGRPTPPPRRRTRPPVGSIARTLVRIGSFTGKELREVIRRPGVLASLIIGPFFVMLVFGLGYSGARSPFVTEVVVPQGGAFPDDPAYYADLAPGRLDVRDVGT